MAELELLAWLFVGLLSVALLASLVALARARRRARDATAEAASLRGMALDPIGARLIRLDQELEQLGR